MPTNVIFGTGPLGLAVARRLAAASHEVRLVNRSGRAPAPEGVEVVATDATDLAASRMVCKGASVVYHCATGPYGRWAQFLPPIMNGIIEGASAAGAKLVYGDNLYAYGPVEGPITEGLPYRPIGPNTRARADVANTLMSANAAGKLRATIGRASDFYGPDARQSTAGDGLFARALDGKGAQVLGDPDTAHTYTFIDDFASGLVTLADHDEALGEVWHIPSAETVTTRRLIEMVFAKLQRPAKLQPAPELAITLLALFVPAMAAVRETGYQRQNAWVVDHSKFSRAFGGRPTPHEQAISLTLDWFRSNSSRQATQGSPRERKRPCGFGPFGTWIVGWRVEPWVKHENIPCALDFRTTGLDGRRRSSPRLGRRLDPWRLPRSSCSHRAVAWIRYR